MPALDHLDIVLNVGHKTLRYTDLETGTCSKVGLLDL